MDDLINCFLSNFSFFWLAYYRRFSAFFAENFWSLSIPEKTLEEIGPARSFPGELGAIREVMPRNPVVSSRRCRRARSGLKLAEAVVEKRYSCSDCLASGYLIGHSYAGSDLHLAWLNRCSRFKHGPLRFCSHISIALRDLQHSAQIQASSLRCNLCFSAGVFNSQGQS